MRTDLRADLWGIDESLDRSAIDLLEIGDEVLGPSKTDLSTPNVPSTTSRSTPNVDSTPNVGDCFYFR